MLRLSRLVGGLFLVVVVATFVGRVLGAPLGRGVVNVPLGPTRAPITLTVWYSTEKERWLKSAIEQFAASNPTANERPIHVTLVGMGSNEIAERVAKQDWRGSTPPAAISPASMLQIDLLNREAGGNMPLVLSGADAPQPLVLTPLVLVGWEDRVKALWPNGPQPQSFWRDLHDALTDPRGWQGRGGSPEWGLVKFGHTSPLTSNSGTQTLVLMAYGFHNKTRGLTAGDVNNTAFQKWMQEIEQAVPEFGDSTGTFMTNMIQFGPGKYDLVAVYENVALQDIGTAQNRWGQPLRMFYPPATLLSEHPFAILGGSWVEADQQQAARVLRSFLLSEPMQRLALESGFRPANSAVSITSNDPKNPFVVAQAQGAKAELGALAELPPAEVTRALMDIWRTQVGR